MNDLDFDCQPFRCFPASWEPEIRSLLTNIAETLTPAQQAAFRLTDIKEKHGRLRLYWTFDSDCPPLEDGVEDRIESLIDAAEERLARLP